MFAWIGKFVFNVIYRWKFVGSYPGNDKSYVVIVAPHTSMWDVPLGISLKWWQQMNITFYVKEELFFFPLNLVLKAIQAVPIKRSGNTNFVSAVVKDFKEHGNRRILITPEGTRKKVNKFKTGFYYIAKGAGVPILPVIFDFKAKEIIFNDFFYPTDNDEKDISQLEDLFDGYQGKVPEFSFSKDK